MLLAVTVCSAPPSILAPLVPLLVTRKSSLYHVPEVTVAIVADVVVPTSLTFPDESICTTTTSDGVFDTTCTNLVVPDGMLTNRK
jgi:hypothetical protein